MEPFVRTRVEGFSNEPEQEDALGTLERRNWNVVAVGNWNPAIFSPPWVAENLAGPETEIEVGIALGQPGTPVNLKFNGVVLEVSPFRLSLNAVESDVASLSTCAQVMAEVCGRLQHTPVRAIGTNFRFRVKEPDQELFRLFDTHDLNRISEQQFRVASIRITRRLEWDSRSVNATLVLNESGSLDIDLNFHVDVDSAKQAKSQLEADTTELVGIAEKLALFLAYEADGVETNAEA